MKYDSLTNKNKEISSSLSDVENISLTTSGYFSTTSAVKSFSKSIEEYESTTSQAISNVEIDKPNQHGIGALREVSHELSKLRLDGVGIISESIIRTRDISAQIIEVTKDFVVLECLMNQPQRIYHRQTLKRDILEGLIPLKQGQLVLIRMKDLKGGNSVEYIKGDEIVSPDDFNVDDFFEGMDLTFVGSED